MPRGTGKLASLVMLAGLLAVTGAQAGTKTGATIYCQVPGCERRAYCVLNYWMPITFGIRSMCHGPTRYTFAPDYFKGIPISSRPICYRCRAINPRVYALDHYYPGIRMPVDPGPPPPPGSGTPGSPEERQPPTNAQGQPIGGVEETPKD